MRQFSPWDTRNLSVSIVIPLFNGARYLPQLLESIDEQDWPGHIEVVCCDDHSSDEGMDLVVAHMNESKDSYILFSHRENQGIECTDYDIISRSSGDFVALVAQDDVLPRNYLSRMVDSMLRTGSVRVQCSFVAVSADLQRHISTIHPPLPVLLGRTWPLILFWRMVTSSGGVFRGDFLRDLMRAIGPCSDWERAARASLLGRTSNCAGTAYIYRVHSSSLNRTHGFAQHHRETQNIRRRYLQTTTAESHRLGLASRVLLRGLYVGFSECSHDAGFFQLLTNSSNGHDGLGYGCDLENLREPPEKHLQVHGGCQPTRQGWTVPSSPVLLFGMAASSLKLLLAGIVGNVGFLVRWIRP